MVELKLKPTINPNIFFYFILFIIIIIIIIIIILYIIYIIIIFNQTNAFTRMKMGVDKCVLDCKGVSDCMIKISFWL